ncbi:MAG: CDP-alcohol phosphatidyltransferase family protein [Nitrospiraceae bacterium]
MPSLYDLKPAFQDLLRPLTGLLARAGITPNQVTVAAMALSFAIGGAVVWGHQTRFVFLLIPLALFLRVALNATDGMLAREHHMTSKLGAILNELGDVLSDMALYLPFAAIPGVSGILVVPVVVLALVSEMTGVLAVLIGAQRRHDGPMGKSDRAVIFGLLALMLGLGAQPGRWLDAVLILMLALLVLTIFNRAHQALKEAP